MELWQLTAVLAVIAFFRKVYYHDSYLNVLKGTNDNVVFGLFRRIFSPQYFLPIQIEGLEPNQIRLIKTANSCIYLFYIFFALSIALKATSI